ncbi:MAG: T9SS type A sorting domain-containing protein [Bacteroidales bacterium]|nr:T9SS type A sorting domain-containing protein [Bacteroidales bacterium]
MKIKFCFFVVLIGLTQQIAAQNQGAALRHLDINPVLINAANREARAVLFVKSERPALKLPFFDDFSSLRSPFPNDSLWEDNMVFINASFPLFPPTIGVATFDALDAAGRLYEHAALSPDWFGADTLTSRPIRLDSIFDGSPRELTNADSVFFSFYFQPGGGFGTESDGTIRGRAPRASDELILEFRDSTGIWNVVWYANGQTLAQFCPLCVVDSVLVTPATDTTPAVFRLVQDFEKEFFRQVSISILDTMAIVETTDTIRGSFLYNGFQFRFRNISSLDRNQQQNPSRQGSGGQWHIDYVRLNAYPNGFNRFSSDIAFVHQGERVLRDFQAMPANQFRGQVDLISEIPILFRNLDTIWHAVQYSFQITGPGYFWAATPSNTAVEPFYTHGFNYNTDIYEYQRNFPFPPEITASGIFEIQHVLTSTNREDIARSNDTMIQAVHFGNYFAYDDGTPEAGFGFDIERSRPTSNEFAYRFPMRVPDSLVAIQIWFNETPADMSRAFFNFAVWSENNGAPSQDPIYVGQDLLPEQGDTAGFFTYWLDAPLPLSSGDFFIGFQQRGQSATFFLNVGFDLNNNARNHMLGRLDGGRFINGRWDNSWDTISIYGAVMMRPVFGTSEDIPPPTSILDRDEGVDADEKIRVFPNPSDGVIFVESPKNVVNSYEVFDLSGRRLLQRIIKSTQFSVDLPQNPGLYILVLHTESGIVSKRVVRR